MGKKIVVMGTLDTKGEEHLFLKQKIEEKGLETVLIDTAVTGPAYVTPDISRQEVCKAAGYDIADLIRKKDRKLAIGAMALGASEIVKKLYQEKKIDGIISLGGSQGTYISTTAMKSLPFGIPKVMVSTTLSGDVSGYIGYKDITMMHSITDILGLNSFNKRFFTQAAFAICAMVDNEIAQQENERPLVAVTMFGVTTPCVMKIKSLFEKKSHTHDIIVFHARGSGGRAMEELIHNGLIAGVIDITTTELADELVGGIRSAGPHRMEAAGEMGIPQVIGPGALDMVNFGSMDSIPKKFDGRKFYGHTPEVTVMRTSIEENKKLGKIMAEKLNHSRGKTIVIMPKRGFSALDKIGEVFYDLDCDLALIESLKESLDRRIKFIEIDCHINDTEFAEQVVKEFFNIIH